MRAIANPARLMLSPEIGALVRQASYYGFSAERLEYNRRMIEAALGDTVGPGGGLAARLLHRASWVAKVGIVALGLVGAAWLWRHGQSGRGTVTNASPRAAVVQQPVAGDSLPSVAAVRAPAPPTAPTTPVARPHALVMHEAGPSSHDAKLVPPSSVAAQLKLFHAAEALARAGRYDEALSTLAVLDERYPHGSLETEAMVNRAEYLWLAGRDDEAVAFIESQINNPAVAARKAELWLTLGDVRQRQGSCAAAVAAYQRALGLGLRPADAEAARKGLHRCTP